jgi:hypothetical protein
MWKIILFIPMVCFADPIMTVKNLGGGSIVLTDEPCYDAKMHKALSYHTKIGKTFGCYYVENDNVLIRWKSGIKMSYSIEIFTPLRKEVKENALLSL